MNAPIRLAQPSVSGNESVYLADCLSKRELSWRGSYVERFEAEFARFCGTRYAVVCCNGTAALHLALLAAGVNENFVVVLPALSYVATANAVRYVGAEPIFCDIDPKTWTMDPADVEKKMAKLLDREGYRRNAVFLPVHLYGIPANMTALNDLADTFNALIIEDAAEAHGATFNNRPVGSFSHAGCFSFFGNKILTTGEGGAVTTNSGTFADQLRLYRGQGQRNTPYNHEVVGYNYRLTNLQAAVGLAQLERYPEFAEKRAAVDQFYRSRLAGYGFEFPSAPPNTVPANWLTTVLVPESVNRDALGLALEERGIETRPIFTPLTDLPMYRQRTPFVTGSVSARGLSLPTHTGLSESDLNRVTNALIEVAARG